MSLSGATQIFSSDTRTETATAQHLVGQLGVTPDGRKYRYTKAGGSDLAPGKISVAAVSVADHTNVAVAAAAAAGATAVTVTLAATAATLNQYAGGYLTINNEAGEGVAYLVSGHPAADASASLVVTLKEAVTVALTTSSKATLSKNKFDGTVISVTDQLDLPTGVPNITITAAQFGWSQTSGPCPVLADETLAIGISVTIGSSIAGAVEAVDASGEPVIGNVMEAGVDTEYHLVDLMLD